MTLSSHFRAGCDVTQHAHYHGRIQNLPQLHSEFEAILDYIRPCHQGGGARPPPPPPHQKKKKKKKKIFIGK